MEALLDPADQMPAFYGDDTQQLGGQRPVAQKLVAQPGMWPAGMVANCKMCDVDPVS